MVVQVWGSRNAFSESLRLRAKGAVLKCNYIFCVEFMGSVKWCASFGTRNATFIAKILFFTLIPPKTSLHTTKQRSLPPNPDPHYLATKLPLPPASTFRRSRPINIYIYLYMRISTPDFAGFRSSLKKSKNSVRVAWVGGFMECSNFGL